MSMKNSSDTTGNRTRELPACSAVPQSISPPQPVRLSFMTLRINSYYLHIQPYMLAFVMVNLFFCELRTEFIYEGKGKVIPLQARCGPEGG